MNKKASIAFGVVLLLGFAWVTFTQKDKPRLIHIQGQTMGSIWYNVKYMGKEVSGLDRLISEELVDFNQSLSTYMPDSEISRLNKSGSFIYESEYFYPVLASSRQVFEKTGGAFDPTIGPLVQAWGFGPDKTIPDLDTATVDSLKRMTGFEQISFDENKVQIPSGFQLDFSAIAKGYAVDVVANLLEGLEIFDYLVEIGGEVRCSGLNAEGKNWTLGIEDPTVSGAEQRALAIVGLENKSLATSGNYRNFYEVDGQTFAHIIDPVTGFTARHNLLSASVFAETCMEADAYATAFMVLGLEKSREIIEQSNVDALLIYRGEEGLETYISAGIKPYVEMIEDSGN